MKSEVTIWRDQSGNGRHLVGEAKVPGAQGVAKYTFTVDGERSAVTKPRAVGPTEFTLRMNRHERRAAAKRARSGR